MGWRDRYRRLCTSPESAAKLLSPRERIYLGGNAATPDIVTAAIAARSAELDGLTAAHVLLLGKDPFADAYERGHFRHQAFFVGPADRDAVQQGRADYIPCHLSEIPQFLRTGAYPIDTAVLMVAPPDNHGFLSLGVEVLASLAAAESAKRVIVQVNPQMPRVYGNAYLHVDQVTAIVEADEPLGTLDSAPPDAVETAIAAHILPLIPEGATLQLGIGGIPNAVVRGLAGRTDLGVHSEMISDGVMNAVEAGIITGARKTLHPRKVVTTFILGSRTLYDWVHENAMIEAHPCDYTNDLAVAARNDRLVSINSALSVDLTGQVNADSMGSRIYSGVGGQVDFVRAAARSRGGVSIIALPATARNGSVSRIVAELAAGAGVVTSRADTRYVITEYGVAELYGKTLRERKESLIVIAAPQHRDALRAGS